MKYSELVDKHTPDGQLQEFLAGGEPVAITLRVPRNLKEAAAEAARRKLLGVHSQLCHKRARKEVIVND